jgi:hypothetical protein
MHRKLSILLLAAIAVSGANSNAQSKPSAKSAPQKSMSMANDPRGYGIAGCGLGSVVLGAKPGPTQIVSGILNNFVIPQTFAISTGTLNCDLPGMGMQAAAFIEMNRPVVLKEASRGQGESIASLANLVNCQNTEAFSSHLQNHFGEVFDNSDSYENARQIIKALENNPKLRAACASLS